MQNACRCKLLDLDLHGKRSSVVIVWILCSPRTKLTNQVPLGSQPKCCQNYAWWRPQSNMDYIPKNYSFSSLISMLRKCFSQSCAKWWGWAWLGARSIFSRTSIEIAVYLRRKLNRLFREYESLGGQQHKLRGIILKIVLLNLVCNTTL